MIRAVLFDVGGVLHTAEPDHKLKLSFSREVLETLKENGMDLQITPEQLYASIELHSKEYKKYAEQSKLELPAGKIVKDYLLRDFKLPEEKLEACAERICYLYDARRNRITMRPYLPETVEELHKIGIRQGIISNIISNTFVPEILKRYGIDRYMECVIMSSSTGIRKPNPKIFHIALRQLGLESKECAYVGDTISRDVIGAREAELGLMIQMHNPAIEHKDKAFLDSGYKPDMMINGFNELVPIIRRINGGGYQC